MTTGSSVLEHVTQQLLHGGVADGAAEEEQLHTLRGDEAQCREEQQQLPKPGGWSSGHGWMSHPGATHEDMGKAVPDGLPRVVGAVVLAQHHL